MESSRPAPRDRTVGTRNGRQARFRRRVERAEAGDTAFPGSLWRRTVRFAPGRWPRRGLGVVAAGLAFDDVDRLALFSPAASWPSLGTTTVSRGAVHPFIQADWIATAWCGVSSRGRSSDA